jgi:hypothetical protein
MSKGPPFKAFVKSLRVEAAKVELGGDGCNGCGRVTAARAKRLRDLAARVERMAKHLGYP